MAPPKDSITMAFQQIQYFNAKTQEFETAHLYILYHEDKRSILQLNIGNTTRISCYNNGKLDDYIIIPALIIIENGAKIRESHYWHGLKHNINGPAVKHFGINGNIIREEYYEFGVETAGY